MSIYDDSFFQYEFDITKPEEVTLRVGSAMFATTMPLFPYAIEEVRGSDGWEWEVSILGHLAGRVHWEEDDEGEGEWEADDMIGNSLAHGPSLRECVMRVVYAAQVTCDNREWPDNAPETGGPIR